MKLIFFRLFKYIAEITTNWRHFYIFWRMKTDRTSYLNIEIEKHLSLKSSWI